MLTIPWVTLCLTGLFVLAQAWLMRSADLNAAGAILVVASASAIPLLVAIVSLSAPRGFRRLVRLISIASVTLGLTALTLLHALAIAGIQLWGMIPTASIVASYLRDTESMSEVWSPRLIVLGSGALAAFMAIAVVASRRLLDEATATLDLVLPFVARRLPARPALVAAFAFTASSLPILLLWRVTIDGTHPNVASVLMGAATQPRSNLDLPESSESIETFKAAREPRMRAAAAPDTIVLIVVDALRADRVRPGPVADELTPNIQRIIRGGGRYVTLRSACAESVCGLTSLFSAREPHHMVRGQQTLTDALREKGYRTYAFLSGAHSNYYGLDERVGRFDLYVDDLTRSARSLNDDASLVEFAFRTLRSEAAHKNIPAGAGRPRFLYFHLMSAHGVARIEERFRRRNPSVNRYYALLSGARDPETAAAVENGYDNGVLQADYYVGQIVTSLRDLRLLTERSLVIITSDHGEALGQDGEYAHGRSLSEPMLKIPLVWLGPSCGMMTSGLRVQAEVSQCIAEAVGLQVSQRLRPGPLTVHLQDNLAALIADDGAEFKRWILDRKAGRIQFETSTATLSVVRSTLIPGNADYRKALCEFESRGIGLRGTDAMPPPSAC